MFKSKILFSVLFAMLMTACSPENDQSETVVDENKLSTITKPKKELVDAKTLYADAAKILFQLHYLEFLKLMPDTIIPTL